MGGKIQSLIWLGGVAGVWLSGCASDGADVAQAEMSALAVRATEGVRTIERALNDPQLASRGLGEGVLAVEAATRGLAQLENDEGVADPDRLMAMVLQARAWDDASRAIAAGGTSARRLPPAQRTTLAQVLEEKAFPARVAAQNSYERALRFVCRAEMDEHPVLLEILDGIERYRGDAPPADRACESEVR